MLELLVVYASAGGALMSLLAAVTKVITEARERREDGVTPPTLTIKDAEGRTIAPGELSKEAGDRLIREIRSAQEHSSPPPATPGA